MYTVVSGPSAQSHLSHLWVKALPQSALVNVVQDASMPTSPLDSCRLERRPCKTHKPNQLSWQQHLTHMHNVTVLKLCRQCCTPCLQVSPSFLSRSFLERVGAEFSAVLVFALRCDSGASDFVGLLFISPPKQHNDSYCATQRRCFHSTVIHLAASIKLIKAAYLRCSVFSAAA